MNEVMDALRRVLPPVTKRTGRGWEGFNCPGCNDRRHRGGLLETPTGGFRYHCFNGGCVYEDDAGWEPGSPFVGKARQLFLDLGGDLSEISDDVLRGITNIEMTIHEWIEYMMSDASAGMLVPETDIARDFPDIGLPPHAVLLSEATGPQALQAQTYLRSRGNIEPFRKFPFCWSPKYPAYVLIPFLYQNKIIGWIGRRTIKDNGLRHLKCPDWPTDYMLNQDHIYEKKKVLVVQSAFDAIALDCVCTFGSKISQKQINLLNHSGREIILVPDYLGTEWKSYLQAAKANKWSLAIPDWGGSYQGIDHIKDPGEAIQRMGLLCTVQKLVDSITTDYARAELEYGMRSR